MAVTAVATSMAGAINYTFTTDTSADFASVTNSTYFYNKADKLVRYKDSTGAVLEIFSASGGASGVFGIANTSGVYTYYATPVLAYAAATVGQTIELFADYTTSSNAVLTITKNVNWNGNGHTWTKTTADESAIFYTTYASCNFVMSNLNLIRQNGTNPNGLLTSNLFWAYLGAAGRIIMTGCYFENQSTIAAAQTAISLYPPAALEIVGLTARSIVGYGAYIGYGGHTITQCSIYGVGGGFVAGVANNCYFSGTTDFGGLATGAGTFNNCVGNSVSGSGIINSGYVYNSTGRSTSGIGFDSSDYKDMINCVGTSVSGYGMWIYNSLSKQTINNTGISSSASGIRFQAAYCYGGTSISTSNFSFFDTNSASFGGSEIYNCNIISLYNNAAGWGIYGNSGTLPTAIVNCIFNLANATAPYLKNASDTAQSIKMRGNTYKGGGAFNANITQAITSTEDNQGNIYL